MNNEYTPNEQYGHLKSESAVAEREEELENPEEIPASSLYKIPWQKKVPKKYPESKQKQDPNPSYRTQFPSGTSQKLQEPINRLGILGARSHSRIRKAPFHSTNALKVERNVPNQKEITYKGEGNPSKWKPIRGHKIVGDYKSRNEKKTYNPLNSEEDTLTYKMRRQDAEEEEESDHYIPMHNEDGEDGDEENQVPYSARINNDARSYRRGSSSRYSENEIDDNERTENIIQSRIEHLKDSVRRELAREF
ncbi:hypothetical protein B7P43_G16286 [Cryptotermes secundus]|uniref:Uncharacterized protein n=1 Tax=Cryptotermes secundus TaxID=105785 RepID=A0A2J7Q1G6_9NEOP|nr:uncharacterized protein LOC111870458 [Cryptotermes secundus]PNF22428.1 hypothetical protein B7P43_G16286 [Cryptotermes secundus]PNF22429.1 hypothetical protein B7P43_G16286 [Cryptotermes secundus]PNF22430.1 hypothetical protein B7P43_G16286 [Cryptotermes secundus]